MEPGGTPPWSNQTAASVHNGFLENLRPFADTVVQVEGDGSSGHRAAFMGVFKDLQAKNRKALVWNGDKKLSYTFPGDAEPSKVSAIGVPEFDTIFYTRGDGRTSMSGARAKELVGLMNGWASFHIRYQDFETHGEAYAHSVKEEATRLAHGSAMPIRVVVSLDGDGMSGQAVTTTLARADATVERLHALVDEAYATFRSARGAV